MKVIDLSHPIGGTMPVFPGTERPEIIEARTLAGQGYAEKKICLYTHTGTHLDAPAHLLAGAATLDRLPAAAFVGPGCVVDVSGSSESGIGVDVLEKNRDRLARAEFVLFHSGWAKRWGDPSYFHGYPVLSEEAARLVAALNLKGAGVDAISFDNVDSSALPVHKIFLSNGMVLVENLCGLEDLADREFVFSCLPLPIAGGDGSPVRAVAIL